MGILYRAKAANNKEMTEDVVDIVLPIIRLKNMPNVGNKYINTNYDDFYRDIRNYTDDDYLIGGIFINSWIRTDNFSPFPPSPTLIPYQVVIGDGPIHTYKHNYWKVDESNYVLRVNNDVPGSGTVYTTMGYYNDSDLTSYKSSEIPNFICAYMYNSTCYVIVPCIKYETLPLVGDEPFAYLEIQFNNDKNDVVRYRFVKEYDGSGLKLYDVILGIPPFETGGDPFNPGGESGTGGGGGDFDNTSTPIEIPELPTVSAASTGFISLFNPTLSQLNELASYLWSDLFEIDGWKKLFADPMDAILGLSILPVTIPTSGPREVKVGNIGTGISLNVASTQFVEVDCGSINVNEYWGAYLDYSPYTQCQIYLPYVGTRPISVDEIMGKTVNVKYHVDILTGACCCFIKCGNSVLYTFNGQCSIPIPINSANYTNVINGIISVAASVGSMIATGGASAPLAIPHLASTVANQMKPNIEKSGAISGSGAVLNIQTPYLILTRPKQALPSKQNEFTGYPSFITATLGELSGYTEVHSIHLENIPATADELSEIETLLKGGVIF